MSMSQESEIDLDKQWLEQANNLAYLFAGKLGLSKDQYIDSLPKFPRQTKIVKGGLYSPLIVQTPTTGLTLAEMLHFANIRTYSIDLGRIKDWSKDPRRFRTPNGVYITWVDDGKQNLDESVDDVRNTLSSDQRGGTIVDGVALVIQKPDLLRDHFFYLPGSEYGSTHVLYMALLKERISISCDVINRPNPYYGSLVARRQILQDNEVGKLSIFQLISQFFS